MTTSLVMDPTEDPVRDITISTEAHRALLETATFQVTKTNRYFNGDGTVTFPVSDEVFRLLQKAGDPETTLRTMLHFSELRT